MYYSGTPSSHYGQGVPRTPPSQIARGNGQLPTPNAPRVAPMALPPSPYTPTHRGLPPTPFMGSVPLPGHPTTAHGLLTPPESPARPGQIALTPILATPGAIVFDMRNPVEYCGLPSNVLNSAATYPPTDRLQISVLFDAIRIEVTNVPYVTVRDVLHRIHRELIKRAHPAEIMHMAAQAHGCTPADPRSPTTRRIDLIAPNYSFAGLAPSGHGWTLIVRP